MTVSDKLYSPKVIKRIMAEGGLAFSKSKGQNFLIDGNIVKKIVKASGIGQDDHVIEIGPGIGTLTQELLQHAGKLTVIELDRGFLPILDRNFGDDPKFNLIEGDALKIDLQGLLSEEKNPVKMVANLPYYITSPILIKLLTDDLPLRSITVMVQKEVGERICAGKNSPDYGALSLLVSLYASDKKLVFDIPGTSFLPAPKVDSCLIHIERGQNQEGPAGKLDREGKKKVNNIIRLAFQKRRKMVIKCFQDNLGRNREDLLKIFKEAGVDAKSRPENLELDDYVNILQLSGYLD